MPGRPCRPIWRPTQVAAYSAPDGGLAAAGRGRVLDAYPLARHRCLLDVGGGEGAFLAAAAAARARSAPDAVRSAAGGRAGAGAPRRGRARRARRRSSAATSSPTRCRTGPTSSRWCGSSTTTTTPRRWRILRAARARSAAGRHAAAGRADGGHARRRADRRRLFRLLPAGDGQRPAAHAPSELRTHCCASAGFSRVAARCRPARPMLTRLHRRRGA